MSVRQDRNGVISLAMAGGMALCAMAGDARVEFRECPKCDRRIRIDLDARKAYVNLCRLDGTSREALAKRAAALLDRALAPLPADRSKMPLMGWSSWNTFGVGISEPLILETAQAMATNGLKAAGYNYVNIDDGFFWGHDAEGRLHFHPTRFPNGMKPVVDGIHALGLKAGIYTDAGANTCGSIFGGGPGGRDLGGVGGGMYGHDESDCRLHFSELGFDFIKVDFCGGREQKLDVRKRYTEIAAAIRATGRSDVRMNICRWAFPGTWAADVAGSWRVTEDIRASWPSIRSIILESLYLSAYSSPGHYNDLDMLEVGQHVGSMKSAFGKHDTGLTADEETAHFGLWCMLSSPLLIGCDVRKIPDSTLRLITNPYLLAASQNELGLTAYVAQREGDVYVLVKDADERFGKSRYVAVWNAGDDEREIEVSAAALDLGGTIEAFDLVELADPGTFAEKVAVRVPPHGAKFFRFDAAERRERTVYQAETAFLGDYQELTAGQKAGTAYPDAMAGASQGIAVRYLGNRESNDLTWRDVRIVKGGEVSLSVRYSCRDAREFALQIDGGERLNVKASATNGGWGLAGVRVRLEPGIHSVRISNAKAWAPDIDWLRIEY